MGDFAPYAPPAADSPAPERGRHPGRKKGPPQASAFVAGLLSLFFPALGHAYARQMRRGAWWLATLPLTVIVVFASLLFRGRVCLWIYFLGVSASYGALRLGTVIDAARITRRRPGPRASVRTILVAAAIIWGLLVAQAFGTRKYLVEAFKIPSGAMIPTIFVGDHVFRAQARSEIFEYIEVFYNRQRAHSLLSNFRPLS